MIKKISENMTDCSIGVLGFRGHLLAEILEKNNIFNYSVLNDESEITNDFHFVFVSGYYKIIPENIIDKPKYGIYCFHESPLPEGRGHAPIQWSLLNSRNNLTISMFKIDKGVDTGLLCYQYNMSIGKMDTYEIFEQKRQIGVKECFNSFLEEVKDGVIVLRQQSGKGNYQTKRGPEDSELDKENYSIEDLWQSIRICDNDNFPAFFRLNDKKVILRYEVVDAMSLINDDIPSN